ncbi:MAG: nickel pincer cofactor biosynthesis protein LarC [Acidimicrobiales bacterium]
MTAANGRSGDGTPTGRTTTGAATGRRPATGTVAWFHCFAGVAGDMALGSLLDAGADLDEVRRLVGRLPLGGWELAAEPVLRGGIACTRAVVTADGAGDRTWAAIDRLLGEASLPPRVVSRARAVFRLLAEVEGRLHGCDPAAVHFHEVGGHDAVVDVVGTAAALEVLGVERVAASPVAVGTGTVRAAHGVLPNPAPAVVRLLTGVPTYGRSTALELTTPTGAALMAALARTFGPMPPMTVAATGFGAGSRELEELPNCTQVVLGAAAASGDDGGQPVAVLEANVDDATGEQLALAVSALLEAGAHDAWVTPVVMKKGRPGHVVHVLADPARTGRLRQVLRDATGTFGVRQVGATRWPAARQLTVVEVLGEPVALKVSGRRVKPEFDDVARVAAATGRPVAEIASLAEQAFRQRRPAP